MILCWNTFKTPDIDGVIGTMVVPLDKTQFYGIVEADSNGKIISMVEKPKQTTSTLAIAGVYAFKENTMIHLYEILARQYKEFVKNKRALKQNFNLLPDSSNWYRWL